MTTLSWYDYVMFRDSQVDSFWAERLKEERDVLFILGLGFDPRMCSGIGRIIDVGGRGRRQCLLFEFNEGPHSPSRTHRNLVAANKDRLASLIKKAHGSIRSKSFSMWSTDGRRVGGRRAAGEIAWEPDLCGYSDVIIDISALPRGIYFPLIAKLLHELGNNAERRTNLHVLVAENVGLDKVITTQGIDETATYVHGFSSELQRESPLGIPVVWIPVLGENKETQLIRIYELVKPDEVCPVVPSPSRTPRRGDDLILQYQELLFDRLRVEPRNIVYSTEQNPFETYRQIYGVVRRYHEALTPLDGCKVVISALSSKLLSIGALLAAWEAKKSYRIGIAHIEPHGYILKHQGPTQNDEELFSLWLAGECYSE